MIKINYKYYLFKFYDNKISKILKCNKKSELKEKLVGKRLNIPQTGNVEFILVKLSKEKKFNPNEKKSGLNGMIGGPIKITFKIMEINDNNIMKPKYEKIKNSKGKNDPDKRNAQFVYIPMDYYENKGINNADIEQLSHWALLNKLEKRLLAPKLITQIFHGK
jgi:hypothetical protein